MQQLSNRNNFNRLSLNSPSSSSLIPPTAQSNYPPPYWWNNGTDFGINECGNVRRNSSRFSLSEVEDSVLSRISGTNSNYSFADQMNTQPSLSSSLTNNVNVRGSLIGAETSSPNIQMESASSNGNGTFLNTTPIINSNSSTATGSSPTNLPSSSSQPIYRPRANSSIRAARNKLRIMAMLDDVRKKRELRDRRKSDIMTYLDDLIVPDDSAMASAAGALKIYRRRFKIYQFLNHPSTGTPWSITYHVMVFVIVFVCLILTICATIQNEIIQERAVRSVYMLEKVVVVWFNIEFGLGLWSCACKKRYRGLMGKVRYLTVPSRLIDLIILSFTTIVLVFNPSKTGHEVFVISAFRGFHRFFQVAQVLTLNRPLKPWKVLASVIYDQREQLFIIYYTEFIVLCGLAYVAFLVERDINKNFDSIADAMWWAIVTLSTVGYGDRVPVTWVGKIISTMFTILGVAIFALPAGIIGTGLALKIEEVERNQIRNRKKVAAAILIQRAYRSWKAHTTYELVSKFFRERPMPIYKQHDYLSMAQKFIALIQFYVALNKFRELLRPLDLKTVMQSYSDGQTEVLLRTKLVQQSIEELAKRVEQTENRVANISLRIDYRQNVFERRIDHIRQLMESCHRQLLANHLLVELLRTSTTALINPGRISMGPTAFGTNRRNLKNSWNRQTPLNQNNPMKTKMHNTNANLNNMLTSVFNRSAIENQTIEDLVLDQSSFKQDQQRFNKNLIQGQISLSRKGNNQNNNSGFNTNHNLNVINNLHPILSSGSNTSMEDEESIDNEKLGFSQTTSNSQAQRTLSRLTEERCCQSPLLSFKSQRNSYRFQTRRSSL
ncbi:Potassium voltage-gated channel subfamily KQT member 4 [Sarcoptes scabiei]|uniref:Potassium voltage-gated channel subfamily KQT member 4 n=1 Tax=Sarcoptes scabiei TaxID=52283 RepID=A0A834VE01_SARSC|nr:Potassium voltage-gated channel subfamily KQT member 4 [Sarcoptes scabiei]